MIAASGTLARLQSIPNVTSVEGEPLARHTRFRIGGPARIYAEAFSDEAFCRAIAAARDSALPWIVTGGGTNLIVADSGFPGIVLRNRAAGIHRLPENRVYASAGADLQTLVDFTIAAGLRGLETLTGIPGTVGGAVYGNAGAYGHSIEERIASVSFFDGLAPRELDNAACEFTYRESVFKRRKEWIVLSAELRLDPASADELRRTAEGILKIRNEKYPPDMLCAGSIFKNLIFAALPEAARLLVPQPAVREGKVASAFFLEKAGAKGMSNGGVRVADYHANLIYNTGSGTAAELRELIAELKRLVKELFAIELEEEVQYVGF